MKKFLFVVVVILVVSGAVFTLLNFTGGNGNVVNAPSDEGTSAAVPAPGSNVPEAVVVSEPGAIIVYTDEGFSPGLINVKAGEQATFKNESSRDFWPASAVHPTHAVYDGTPLGEHCLPAQTSKDGASNAFDACKGVEPGGEWSFTLDKPGTWKYHDHLGASKTGTIIVE